MTENNPEREAASIGQDTETGVEAAQDIMELFLSAADVHAVYAEPALHGDALIIPAAEVLSITGYALGSGYGTDGRETAAGGGGGGGGGGGRVLSRPVAVIVATPAGVEVKPVFDMTKVAIAALTAFGFMIATLSRMNRKNLTIE